MCQRKCFEYRSVACDEVAMFGRLLFMDHPVVHTDGARFVDVDVKRIRLVNAGNNSEYYCRHYLRAKVKFRG